MTPERWAEGGGEGSLGKYGGGVDSLDTGQSTDRIQMREGRKPVLGLVAEGGQGLAYSTPHQIMGILKTTHVL